MQNQLEGAIELDPDNSTLYALLGATHFWHVGESARDPHPKEDQSIFVQDMPTAAALFQKALDLDYYTQHPIGYINDDHLPGYLGITTFHTGQEYRDANLMAKGDRILEFAVYQFPEFNNFNRWAAHLGGQRDSETYKKALGSLWQGIAACIGTKIDRANPDMKPYLGLTTGVGRKKVCWWKGDIAPYGFEGLILNLGNGLVKAGQIDAARVMYANAKYADNYETWPYRNVLEEIAASDLNARAALYAPGANPQNAPPLNGIRCALGGCESLEKGEKRMKGKLWGLASGLAAAAQDAGGKNSSQEKVALVTGVSSGIGRAIAGLLTRSGFRVFGTARGNGVVKRGLEDVELVHVDVRDEKSETTSIQRSCLSCQSSRGCRAAGDSGEPSGKSSPSGPIVDIGYPPSEAIQARCWRQHTPNITIGCLFGEPADIFGVDANVFRRARPAHAELPPD